MTDLSYSITHHARHSKIVFDAMASPCEILVRNIDSLFCDKIAKICFVETKRIENKFSRYLDGNLVSRMNHSNGKAISIDEETSELLEYARNLYELSEGLFDITSGVLRTIWNFSDHSTPPTQQKIDQTLPFIGFNKLDFNEHEFTMPAGMEIDFGGIGKEYAVDKVSQLLQAECSKSNASFLVNFGGDLSAYQFDSNDPPWLVGIESAQSEPTENKIIKIASGAVTTSGNTRRFFQYQGKRYGHLLNPKTGYPVDHAPLSVTCFSSSCVLAGSLSSLAMLQGKNAEQFLLDQEVENICIW